MNIIVTKLSNTKIWRYYSLLIVFLLLVASSATSTASSCNSFPKIFGGSGFNSSLNQFDVFNDYLAMAGDTFDSSLTGITT
jgi:hypothetical protein